MSQGQNHHIDHVRTATVLVRTYHFGDVHEAPTSSETEAPFSSVVLPCRGAFLKHVEGRTVLADTNRAVFFRRGEVYATSPSPGGRLILEIGLADASLTEAERLGLHAEDRPRSGMPTHAMTDDQVALARHLLVRRLGTETSILDLEEGALRIAGHVLASAIDRSRRHAALTRRPATRRAHAEVAEAAAIYLERNMDAPVELAAIAGAVHASPYHLARVFRRETGSTLHRYLTNLRLRRALAGLTDPAVGLTRIALDCGFCSHSHFTREFRRAFGLTPSELRSADRDALRHAIARLCLN